MDYKWIDVSGGFDESHRCTFYIYYYLFQIKFSFQPKLCDVCHNLMQKAISFDFLIVSAKVNDYRIHFWYMSND